MELYIKLIRMHGKSGIFVVIGPIYLCACMRNCVCASMTLLLSLSRVHVYVHAQQNILPPPQVKCARVEDQLRRL